MNLAAWLRAGRDRRKLTIEDVAKITKIQPRILEKLENGVLEGLPAEVFVKGFVRSFAKCVGLDEVEALEKYGAVHAMATGSQAFVAKALVETMARPVDVRDVIEAKRVARGTPFEPAPLVAQTEAVLEAPVVEASVVEAAVVEASVVVEAPAPVVVEAPVAVEATIASTEVASVVASVVVQASSDAVASVEQPETAKKKKGSRKNSKQRARKKKQVQQELAAVAETVVNADHDAVDTTVFEKQSIETGPVAKIDATSIDAASIEAKTSEVLDVPVAAIDGAVESASLAEGSQRISQPAIATVDVAITEVVGEVAAEIVATESIAAESVVHAESLSSAGAGAGTWQPTMPAISTPSVPWRRPNLPAATASTYVVPTLMIDDADPDSADRERDDRIAKEPHRLSFLPPILLDREDRSARQGGLTLAVIILLIAATLTLSYLMRRPSPSGDGVTMLDGSSMLVS